MNASTPDDEDGEVPSLPDVVLSPSVDELPVLCPPVSVPNPVPLPAAEAVVVVLEVEQGAVVVVVVGVVVVVVEVVVVDVDVVEDDVVVVELVEVVVGAQAAGVVVVVAELPPEVVAELCSASLSNCWTTFKSAVTIAGVAGATPRLDMAAWPAFPRANLMNWAKASALSDGKPLVGTTKYSGIIM